MFEDVLCVIPARAGSKGIKDKNLQMVGGKPLICYSILSAQQADIPYANIIVSSDSPRILEIAADMEAVPHQRPDDLCQDTSSTESALLNAVEHYSNSINTVLLLQPTSPIRFKDTITKCLLMSKKGSLNKNESNSY